MTKCEDESCDHCGTVCRGCGRPRDEATLTLGTLKHAVSKLRIRALGDIEDVGHGPFSGNHYRLALGALDAAVQHLDLAACFLARRE